MNISKNINYILILIGAVVALYAQNQDKPNEVLLIGGIVILMIGIYRISKHIPSKNTEEDDTNNVDES